MECDSKLDLYEVGNAGLVTFMIDEPEVIATRSIKASLDFGREHATDVHVQDDNGELVKLVPTGDTVYAVWVTPLGIVTSGGEWEITHTDTGATLTALSTSEKVRIHTVSKEQVATIQRRQRIRTAMQYVDRAKNLGDYQVANEATALILCDFLADTQSLDVWAEMETDTDYDRPLYINIMGDNDVTYMDVMDIVMRDSDGEHRCSIPVPLLKQDIALALAQRAQVVPRFQHDRNVEWATTQEAREAQDAELSAIHDRLAHLVGGEHRLRALHERFFHTE